MHPIKYDHLGRWGEDGTRILVRDVPAQQCERCGERVLEAEVADRVTRLIRDGGRGEVIAMPVVSFQEEAATAG